MLIMCFPDDVKIHYSTTTNALIKYSKREKKIMLNNSMEARQKKNELAENINTTCFFRYSNLEFVIMLYDCI